MAKAVKTNKAVIIDSIVKHLEKGKGFSDVLKVIGSKWQLSESTFARYWKIANEAHREAQQGIKEAKAALDLESALSERKSQIADVLERKEVLTKIMRGEMPLLKHVVVDRVIEYIEVVPDYMDRKNAIAELNKMEGDYAPAKVAQTDSQGNDVTPTIQITTVTSLPIAESE